MNQYQINSITNSTTVNIINQCNWKWVNVIIIKANANLWLTADKAEHIINRSNELFKFIPTNQD